MNMQKAIINGKGALLGRRGLLVGGTDTKVYLAGEFMKNIFWHDFHRLAVSEYVKGSNNW